MRARNLSIFRDALSHLKHELKNLGTEYKIKEFGLDDKKTISELYDEWLVAKALRGRPSPLSFLGRKYERDVKKHGKIIDPEAKGKK
jgi:hypothetical protein